MSRDHAIVWGEIAKPATLGANIAGMLLKKAPGTLSRASHTDHPDARTLRPQAPGFRAARTRKPALPPGYESPGSRPLRRPIRVASGGGGRGPYPQTMEKFR